MDYYSENGILKGFSYSLVKNFSDFIGTDLHITTVENIPGQALKFVKNGEIDIYAGRIYRANAVIEEAYDIIPLGHTDIVLVNNKRHPVFSFENIKGKDIFVPNDASLIRILLGIRDSLKSDFNLRIENSRDFNQLMFMVEQGEIEYTAGDKTDADIACSFFKNTETSLPLKRGITYGWAINSKAYDLRDSLMLWSFRAQKNGIIPYMKSQYFNYNRDPEFYTEPEKRRGKISIYDTIIKSEARHTDRDWKLLAALIHTESRFNPAIRSKAGASGLMQIMPNTAKNFGITDYMNPTNNIRCGALYLKYLETFFPEDIYGSERIKFIIASYNVGPGHIFDAIRLAEKYGKKKHVWDRNVDSCIILKSRPEFYNDSIVKNGYCNGRQVYAFVKDVLKIYSYYKHIK